MLRSTIGSRSGTATEPDRQLRENQCGAAIAPNDVRDIADRQRASCRTPQRGAAAWRRLLQPNWQGRATVEIALDGCNLGTRWRRHVRAERAPGSLQRSLWLSFGERRAWACWATWTSIGAHRAQLRSRARLPRRAMGSRSSRLCLPARQRPPPRTTRARPRYHLTRRRLTPRARLRCARPRRTYRANQPAKHQRPSTRATQRHRSPPSPPPPRTAMALRLPS
jgi:hypothetical protein